ncbi:hypothetical protein TNCV_1041361 [Trichonephila clavipes]|nr:hypothetical protein TNCV_1041361 [Trichonephila clavipes]
MDKCVQMWSRNYGALGQTARVCFGVLCANQTREVKRDFCDLPMRRNEGRVVNTPLVFRGVRERREKGVRKKGGRERRTRRPGREKGRKVGRGERKESGRDNGRKQNGEETRGEDRRDGWRKLKESGN